MKFSTSKILKRILKEPLAVKRILLRDIQKKLKRETPQL